MVTGEWRSPSVRKLGFPQQEVREGQDAGPWDHGSVMAIKLREESGRGRSGRQPRYVSP
jgi:hypothetical protein